MRPFLAAALSVLLGGCALMPRVPPPALPLLPPQALGREAHAQQVLHVAYGDKELTMQCAFDATPSRDTLVALGPFGQRFFTLNYGESGLKADVSPYVPDDLPPRQVLADVQLALWPVAAWQQRLQGTGWVLTTPQPGVRRLRHDGALVAEVHYDAGSDGWQGRFWLVNLAYGYTLDITSEVDP